MPHVALQDSVQLIAAITSAQADVRCSLPAHLRPRGLTVQASAVSSNVLSRC